MKHEQILASFQVHVTDVPNGNWEGFVEANGTTYHFHSEIQLLRWLLEQFPVLSPKPAQDLKTNKEHKEV